MPNAQGIMRRVAAASTKVIALSYGDALSFYYVCEYPKSGGTWVSKMVADALQLPFPQHAVMPIGFSAVIHNHWPHSPRLKRAIHLYRDGRDAMVSYFFHYMRDIRAGGSPWSKEYEKTFDRLFGKGYDPDDSVGLLPKFIEHCFKHPRGSRLNWTQYIETWLPARGREGVSFVSYEELRNDCAGALRRVVDEIGRPDTEEWKIEQAVERNSMERATGRRKGQEDRTSFIRKGAVGDWRNHFTREAAQVFDDLAGEALVALGYEPDRGWVSSQTFVGEENIPPAVRIGPDMEARFARGTAHAVA